MKGVTLRRGTEGRGSTQKPKASPTFARNFQFINVAGSFRDRDPEPRKLVRSHVMKGTCRHRNREESRLEKAQLV